MVPRHTRCQSRPVRRMSSNKSSAPLTSGVLMSLSTQVRIWEWRRPALGCPSTGFSRGGWPLPLPSDKSRRSRTPRRSHESDTRWRHRIIENGYHGLDRGSLRASEQLHRISATLSDERVHFCDKPSLSLQIMNHIGIFAELAGDLHAWDANRTHVSRERMPTPLVLDVRME
jgi:hypothetical protein